MEVVRVFCWQGVRFWRR